MELYGVFPCTSMETFPMEFENNFTVSMDSCLVYQLNIALNSMENDF